MKDATGKDAMSKGADMAKQGVQQAIANFRELTEMEAQSRGKALVNILPLKEGAVRDLRNGAITTADPISSANGGVPIQTCISAAAGACTLGEKKR